MRPGLRRPLRPCLRRGCPELVASGYCPAHAPPAWATTETSPRQRGYGASWERLRRRALRRDGWRCRICGQPARQVDHILPRTQGGADELANLRSLCDDCHATVTGRAGGAARRGRC